MKKIIAANWKMHFTIQEAEITAKKMVKNIKTDAVDIVVFPSFVHLDRLGDIFNQSLIKLGAQNMHFEEKGAFTGEISPSMLESVGCKYVILGHSERRHIFKEDNELIGKKIKSAVGHGLIPILCVGETLEERNQNRALDIIKTQLEEGLKGVDNKNVIIAYEPVWAIGTGVSADTKTIEEMHDFIRDVAGELPILYGGSVKAKNAEDIAGVDNVDGFLVGSASLIVEEFREIIDKFIEIKGV